MQHVWVDKHWQGGVEVGEEEGGGEKGEKGREALATCREGWVRVGGMYRGRGGHVGGLARWECIGRGEK